MSSILKALKRVEALKDEAGASPVWPSLPNTQRQIHNRRMGWRKWVGVICAIAFVFLVTGLGWVGWQKYRKPDVPIPIEKPSNGEPLASARITPAKPIPPSPLPGKVVPKKSPPAASFPKEPMPPVEIPKPHNDISSVPLSVSPQQDLPVMENSKQPEGRIPPEEPKNEPQSEPLSVEKEPLPQVIKSSEVLIPNPKPLTGQMAGEKNQGIETPKDNPKPLKEGRLLLQAIAWSSIPEKRMAVISNEVVKEGKSVQGFEVVQIKEGGVVLKEKGQTWSLGFVK